MCLWGAAGRGGGGGGGDSVDEFPAGLRVLVVDDDPICLMILERMLHQCSYQVTTCGRATKALELLREDKDKFDLVISDVYMPDMDGFKLLELVGLEMDLPVIMMSADGETSAVMKGITHGACDYLLKPVRLEELRNIWQHVLRKKRTGAKDVEHSTSHEEGERRKFGGGEDVEYTSSATDTTDGNCKLMKRRKEMTEDDEDTEQENDDPSTLKKPRVVWSVELHQQFVSAVHQLGIDKAVPKRILELMSVHGLTRENVASHLQKYRLYLRRLSGVTSQQNGMNVMFGGSETAFGHVSSLDSIGNLRTLAATGQLSPQTLAGVHASKIGREGSPNCMGLPSSNTRTNFLLPPPQAPSSSSANNFSLLPSKSARLLHRRRSSAAAAKLESTEEADAAAISAAAAAAASTKEVDASETDDSLTSTAFEVLPTTPNALEVAITSGASETEHSVVAGAERELSYRKTKPLQEDDDETSTGFVATAAEDSSDDLHYYTTSFDFSATDLEPLEKVPDTSSLEDPALSDDTMLLNEHFLRMKVQCSTPATLPACVPNAFQECLLLSSLSFPAGEQGGGESSSHDQLIWNSWDLSPLCLVS
ncbi:unnamed protein product [Sphagnum compactum]